MLMQSNNLILNGFDRCGSTAIARTLATHPQIELIFHPFNSGSIRSKMYQILTEKTASNEDIRFFKDLEDNVFHDDYVVSPWFEKYSTVTKFVPGKLHVLKTTINHLSARWVSERFPYLEVWGVWRDPIDILASLVRNDFFDKWYLDAIPQMAKTVKESSEFPDVYRSAIGSIEGNTVRSLIFLITTRSFFFFKYLSPGKLINYEVFKSNPNLELAKITTYFGLNEYHYDSCNQSDLNVVGLKYEDKKSHRGLVDKEQKGFVDELTCPLFEMMAAKFGHGPWRNPNSCFCK